MKRTRSELELIKSFVDGTYSRFGMRLVVNVSEKYNYKDPDSNLGFCFKHVDKVLGSTVYKIVCSKIGIDETDFRVLMHEYGHIYLGHLDGIHEDLDGQICRTIEDYREELIADINRKCGIDFADKLIERIIDDPQLNHSLHNIAMDMEVNSSILSLEDIDEMEKDISSIMPSIEEEMLKDADLDEETKKKLEDKINKYKSESKIKLIHPFRYYLESEEGKNPIPFPDNLTYPEYLLLIISHLDQFIKMLVSIKMGGSGDTSQVTQQDIMDALNGYLDKLQGKSEEYKQGYRDAVKNAMNNGNQPQQQQGQQGQGQPMPGGGMPMPGQSGQGQPMPSGQGGSDGQGSGQSGSNGQPMPGQGQGSGTGSGSQQDPSATQGQGSGSGQDQQGGLSDYEQGYQDALRDMQNAAENGQPMPGQGNGMQSLSDLMHDVGMSEPKENPYKGIREDPTKDSDYSKDHKSDSRDDADKKREVGQIRNQGGTGCGSSGGPDVIRDVDKTADKIEMALKEVVQNMKHRVVKFDTHKDNMKNYNRGVIRSVIAPSFSRKVTINNTPKIVYLIDISGSMDTYLIDRCLGTIALSMKKLSRGLKYDIITWSTHLGEHIKDIDPRKPITKVSGGGGTSIARGIQYFKDNYGPDAILVIISDFEDYLEEWQQVEETMDGYDMYGFNYGNMSTPNFKNLKVRYFDR